MNRLYISILIYIVLLFIPQIVRVSYERRVWCVDCAVRIVVQATGIPQKRGREYRIEHRGLPIECPITVSDCLKLDKVLPGDQIEIFGTITEGVIGSADREKRLMGSQITELHLLKPKPLISWWWWVRELGHISGRIVLLYKTLLPQPHAGLLAGIVLGDTSTTSFDFYESLVNTGTLHVVAASGFNVAFVGALLLQITTTFLHRKVAVFVSIVGIGIYALLAGAGPAVTRAAVMGGMAFVAQGMGKEYWAKWALGLTVLIFLLFSPWLLESISFQLSVAATAGILWGEQAVRGLLPRTRARILLALEKDLSTTLAATLATLPVTLVHFGQTSWISPLVNVLVLWLVPPLMVIGVIIAIGGWVLPYLAYLAYPLLELFISHIAWFGSLPGIRFSLSGNWWFAVGWWMLLLAWWMQTESIADKSSKNR